jgi:antitoxin HicB
VTSAQFRTVDYRVVLRRDDNDTFLVSFPDFPEAHTFGTTRDEALERARDALATVIDAYIKDRRPLPNPSRGRGRLVAVPALTVAKMELHDQMLRSSITKRELARRLDVHLPQVDRLLDVHHASRLDQLERAFDALGTRMVLAFRRANAPSVPAGASRQTVARRSRRTSGDRPRVARRRQG